MNLEQDLSDALHGVFGSARPNPDLSARIMAATRSEAARSHSARRGTLLALAGLAAALVLAAVVLTVARPQATASQEPSAAASAGLTHYAVGWLSFDYPKSWKSKTNVLPWVLGLWTGSDPADCLTPTPQPSGPDSHCGRQGPLLPGTLYVTVGDDTSPEPPVDPSQPSALPKGGQYVTVAGMPAILASGSAATEQTLDWTISRPKEPHKRLQIHAEFAEPGADEMRAEIVAMVGSIKFANQVKPLDLSLGNHIEIVFMSGIRAYPGLACLPTGVVTAAPDGRQLSKPLPVSCGLTMEPVASVGLWRLSLTERWTSDADRTAGSYTLVFWLDPDVEGYGYDGAWQIGGSATGGGPDVLGDPFPYVSEDPFPHSS